MQSEVYLEKNHGMIILVIVLLLLVALLFNEMFEASSRHRALVNRVDVLQKQVHEYEELSRGLR